MKRPAFAFMDVSKETEEDAAEFSFGEGGLLRTIERACHLTKPWTQVACALALTWLPIVLFGVYSEVVQGQHEPILHDVGVHVRLLVATPIFLVLDHVFPMVCRVVLVQLTRQSFIREEDKASFEALWRGVARRADSNVPELLIGVVSLGLGVAVLLDFLEVRGVTGTRELTWAQRWYAMTDLPLFQFLLWRSVWRWLLWVRILLGVSRLPLDLIPTHPDRRGGISFLRKPSIGYCATLLFAISSVVVAEWGEHFIGESAVDGLKPLLLLFAVIGISFAFGPLLAYVPLLFHARYFGLLEVSAFASRYARKIRLRRAKLAERELLLGRDLQGLAALNATYRDTVDEMKLCLFYKKDIIVLLAATLAPLVPLALWNVPQEEWGELIQLLAGTAMP